MNGLGIRLEGIRTVVIGEMSALQRNTGGMDGWDSTTTMFYHSLRVSQREEVFVHRHIHITIVSVLSSPLRSMHA